ncbi:helix-turn-helix domain-containing protein [Blastomonas sp.]|uniref:helix-turn-helix domain-containing protein n=1 Tax=Blastomonas sp. TaxID=1909299 RepID=UPI0035938D85
MKAVQCPPHLQRFIHSLKKGRHYGGSADSECWVMVGRDLRDVTSWSIIPPAASLTYAWGHGGCTLEFGGGKFHIQPGDLMWIDAGFAHRGENLPGSDFFTVFIPQKYVAAASLDIEPIGAWGQPAPTDLANMLMCFAARLLDGASTRAVEAPLLDTILDWVGTIFEPLKAVQGRDMAVSQAAAMLRADKYGDLKIADVAAAVGLSSSDLSKRFKRHYRLTPKLYRKQLRLALATRTLASGSSVLAAAHESGFSDTAHLSRSFRDQYGIAPSLWSRKIAG